MPTVNETTPKRRTICGICQEPVYFVEKEYNPSPVQRFADRILKTDPLHEGKVFYGFCHLHCKGNWRFYKKTKSGKMLLIKKVTKDNARIVETRIGMLKV